MTRREPTFEVVSNYYVSRGTPLWMAVLQDPRGYIPTQEGDSPVAYLYPDQTLHDRWFVTDTYNGLYTSPEDAKLRINHFVRLGGLTMCDISKQDPKILNGVTMTLQKFHKARRMFTAYDVTAEVRRMMGPVVPVPHSTVKDIVHELFRRGREWYTQGYTSDIASHIVTTKSVPPVVYMPIGRNVTDYSPTAQQSAPPAPPLQQHVADWKSDGECAGIVRVW